MKKFFLPLLAILLPAVFISCENFLSSNTEFREKISEEVKISTASSVNVVVLPKAGTGEVSKSAIEAKVGVPFMVQFFADENAEFLRWTAFSEYDETKTMDDQLGTTVVQYKNADNTNETGASFVKVEVTILKDIGQVTLVPWCGARPRVTTTEPVNYSTNVVRTTPIKIRFSKAIDESCISTKENPEIYKNYFELYQRDTANSDEKFIDLSKYFDAPVIKNEKEIWFNCKEKTDESKWLKAGSVIRFVVKGSLKDADGVRFDDTTSIEFTLGAKGDGTGPIIAISEFKNGTNDIHQTVFGNWEPRSGAAAGVYYADTDCRVSGSGSFSMKVKGDDSTTGDTGLMGFSVIQRLVYVPKGAYLPGTDDEKAASDLIPFDEGKTKWNYLSGILESDFKKETIFEYKSENTDFEKTFEIDEGFKTTSGKTVDGIYMFEVTALDGNSNYASNPCYYYVVRDTTAPDGKENAAKVKFTDDCGVAVNGKRFFGRNYRTVKFRIDGKISDFGTQGLPWTACKSEECRWAVALSTSDTVCDSSTMVGDWCEFALAGTNLSVEIPDSYFASNPRDRILYGWVKFEDGFNNISDFKILNVSICVDAELPSVTMENRNYVLSTDSDGNPALYKREDGKLVMDFSDSGSGLKSIRFGKDGVMSEISNKQELDVEIGNTYSIKVIDLVDNEYFLTFKVLSAVDFSPIYLTGNNSLESVYQKEDGSFTEEFDELTLPDNIKFSKKPVNPYKGFAKYHNGIRLNEDYLDKNGISVYLVKDYFKTPYYTQGKKPEESDVLETTAFIRWYRLFKYDEDYNEILLQTEYLYDRDINYIPIEENSIKGDVELEMVVEMSYTNPSDYGSYLKNDGFSREDFLCVYFNNKVNYVEAHDTAELDFNPPVVEFNKTQIEHNADGSLKKDADGNYYYNMVMASDDNHDRYEITDIKESTTSYIDSNVYGFIEVEGSDESALLVSGQTVTLPENKKITVSDFSGQSISFYVKKCIDTQAPRITVKAPYTDRNDCYWYYDGTSVEVSIDDEKLDYVVYTDITNGKTYYSYDKTIKLTADDYNGIEYEITAYDFCGNRSDETVTVKKDTNDGSTLDILGFFPEYEFKAGNDKWFSTSSDDDRNTVYRFVTTDYYDYGGSALSLDVVKNYRWDKKKFRIPSYSAGITEYTPCEGTYVRNAQVYIYGALFLFQCQNSAGISNVDITFSTKQGLVTINQYCQGSYDFRNLYRPNFERNTELHRWVTREPSYVTAADDWIFITATDMFDRKFTTTQKFTFE